MEEVFGEGGRSSGCARGVYAVSSESMGIALDLTPEQEARLRSVARELNVSPEALAGTGVRDLLTQPDDAFVRLARGIVEENREIYEHLR